jgi:hypothetical protein
MESATIGKAAGEIWAYLDVHGTVSLPQLQKGTHLSARLLAMGLGWLAREDKLVFVQDRPVLKLRLQDAPPA